MTVKETSSTVLRPRVGWVPVGRLNFSRILLLIGAPVVFLQLFSFIASKTTSGDSGILPVSIRAESQADYRSDPQGLVVPGISGNILLDIIQDSPGDETTAERVAALEAVLSADIPTMTSLFGPTPTSDLSLPIDPAVTATPAPLTVTPPIISTPTPGSINPTLPVQASPTVPPVMLTLSPVIPTTPPLLPTSTSPPPASASPTPILPTLPPLLPTLTSLFP